MVVLHAGVASWGTENQQLCSQVVEDPEGLMGTSLYLDGQQQWPLWEAQEEVLSPDGLLQPGKGRAHLLLQGTPSLNLFLLQVESSGQDLSGLKVWVGLHLEVLF